MRKVYPLLLLFLFSTCEKETTIQTTKEYPKEVSFLYDNELVTYNVIKKEYKIGANGDTLIIPITKLWLDRNLGAERPAESWNDSLAYGDLFQWGRPADGHQKRDSDTTTILSDIEIPTHSKFILASYSSNLIDLFSNDWLSISNDLLWNGTVNKNCSCPEGWRVSTIEELKMEMYSWDSVQYYGAFDSDLKWAASGYREVGEGRIYYDGW